MNEKRQKDDQRPKRPYQKPEVVQIPLRPDEAVLGFCKSSHSGGPGAATSCHVGTCNSPGS
jgi:hypothetical protein